MFSTEIEVIICIALAVVTVLLFLGKGDFMLKNQNENSKKTPAEKKRFSRGLSYFTGTWLIAEMGLLFFGEIKWVSSVYLVVIILAFIGLVIFSKKQV